MTKNEQNEMEMLTLAGVLLERHHIRPANVVSSCLARHFMLRDRGVDCLISLTEL